LEDKKQDENSLCSFNTKQIEIDSSALDSGCEVWKFVVFQICSKGFSGDILGVFVSDYFKYPDVV